ncbi:MAG: hypothetical protein LBP87_05990, partial [Planctomycetaceae bacterium]|nr:hypothetical protein [Planctomycetaceae bacterium]
LPDGDYEIFVLTSSLFWKDCQDRNIRTISIRNGQEIAPFPYIYHLRSSISQGTTIIEWSANQCEIDDCLFALWYSAETPIDAVRQPDVTISYHSSQTESKQHYQVFNRNRTEINYRQTLDSAIVDLSLVFGRKSK